MAPPAVVRWRDPAKKADKEGYQKARKLFEAEVKSARDTIAIKSVDDGLKALQDLEAWMPQGKAN